MTVRLLPNFLWVLIFAPALAKQLRKTCDPKIISCSCGVDEYPIHIEIKQCSQFVSGSFRCGDCKDVPNEKETCLNYKNCLHCDTDEERCSQCPPNRFGKLCTEVCPTCLNGGTCDPDTGLCICQQGFRGKECQLRSGCPSPPVIKGGTFDSRDHYPLGSSVIYRCENGRVMQGSPIFRCLSTGQWSARLPICSTTESENLAESTTCDSNLKEVMERLAKIENTVTESKIKYYENVMKEVIERKIENELESKWRNFAKIMKDSAEEIEDRLNLKWRNYEHKVKEVTEKLDKYAANFRNYEEQLRSLLLKGTLYSKTNGVFVWEVKNFTQKAENRNHFSEPFFSHDSFGYKMNLVFKATNEMFSVYINLMKGPWDAMLNWPCQYKATLLITDHKMDKNVQAIVVSPENQPDVVGRPKDEINNGYGKTNFISMEELKKSFLFNDTIIIKVSVLINEF